MVFGRPLFVPDLSQQTLQKTEAANLVGVLIHPNLSQALRANLCSHENLMHFGDNQRTATDRLSACVRDDPKLEGHLHIDDVPDCHPAASSPSTSLGSHLHHPAQTFSILQS